MRINILLIAILIGFFSQSIDAQTWTKVQLLPGHTGLSDLGYGIFFNDTGIITSEHGLIIKSNDYFNSFTVDSSFDTIALWLLSFPNRNTGYIEDNAWGGLLKTVDGGNSWNVVHSGLVPGYFGYTRDLLFTSSDTGYAGPTYSSTLIATYNGGLSWQRLDTGYVLSNENVLRIRVLHDSIIYLLTIPFNGGIATPSFLFRSTDFGHTWIQLSEFYAAFGYGDFCLLDDSTIVLSNNDGIFKSTDGGLTFTMAMPANDYYLYQCKAMVFTGHDTGYVAYNHSIYKTYDAGNTWASANFSFAPDDSDNTISFITQACSQNIVAGCYSRNIYKMEPGCVVTGITDIPDNSFTLYPNPAQDILYVSIVLPHVDNVTIQITDITGRVITTKKLFKSDHFLTYFNVGNLASGPYLCNIFSSQERKIEKFIKQ